MQHDKIVIFDSGSQYTQLIARKIRELNVYCEIVPYYKQIELTSDIKGVIFSGSPHSVRDTNHPTLPVDKFYGKIPILGICYGAQYLAQYFGGNVSPSSYREYGRAMLHVIEKSNPLFQNIENSSQVWMSHADSVVELPKNFTVSAKTNDIPIAAFSDIHAKIYAIQFHPEVYHTTCGVQILKNFSLNICQCNPSWTPDSYIESTIREIQNQVGQDRVLLAISGGVDSSVAALLLNKAIGNNLVAIFVNNGLLRKNEYEQVLNTYEQLHLNIIGIDASDEFLNNLKGVTDPEQKRKIIGKTFIEVFEREAQKQNNVKWLAQGTIYPDVIESVSVNGPSATIKSHHNVGGLPDKLNLKIIEPLKYLFKDEVRKVGKALQLPEIILNRHPFPGPGLAIRIIGEVTQENVLLLQEADSIFISKLKEHKLYDKVWQAGVVLLPIYSVGVMGDERTYERVIALRAVQSTDGMTADWVHLPYEFLAEVSNTIINQVKGINRVVYDISSKPPATIEWE
ncbi:MAG: glutamine-hydrolyzing GMP synthase [Bacteroidales bacterium]|nr:glutamine-hydrolyzing GMP synthase [Bacteroidales bacterium]